MYYEGINDKELIRLSYERDEKIRKEREYINKHGFPKDSYQRTKKSLEEIRDLMEQYKK